MTNSSQLVKKAFSSAVAATTILWSVGLSAFLPTAASAASFGDLIKGTSLSTVYYYGSDGQRYAFPNEKTYFSWYKDFSSVKTISDAQLASITLAGNIMYRPGARWMKITSDNKVYAVSSNGKLHWVENEATAKGLAGDNWNAHIDDVPDVFFTDYTVGDSLTSAAGGYDGMLWSNGTSTYLVSGSKYQLVTDAAFAANGYNAGFVLKGTGFTKAGLTAGADITAGMSNLTDAAQKVTTPTYAQTQNVSVALASTSPAASTVISGQALADLGEFTFTNPTSSPVTVKTVAMKRTGVSSDATLSNVYLFSGYTRLTDAAAVTNGKFSWNDASGLFTIPAGGSSTVAVRSDIKKDVTGETLGVSLVAATDIAFAGAFSAQGSFPISGSTFSVASLPSSFATVDFKNANILPAASPSATATTDYKVWEDKVQVANNSNGANFYSLRLRNTGSIDAANVTNWRLFVDGVQKGAAVAQQDANGYVVFDLSASPLHIGTASPTFKVIADVGNATGRTIQVGLRSAADVVVTDADFNQPILATKDGAALTAVAGLQTFGAGTLTITLRNDSPSADVVEGASNVTLARYDVKATGEPMKIESLKFAAVLTANAVESVGGKIKVALRNGSVFADGVQIGSTATLKASANNDGDGTSTTYTFGSSFVVYPGTPAILEVHSDIYDSLNDNNALAADNGAIKAIKGLTARLVNQTGAGNVYQKTTLAYIDSNTSNKDGIALTIKAGTLTVSKNASFASQQISTLQQNNLKIGSYTLSSSSAEPVNVTELGINLTGTNLNGKINNLYLEYGPVGSMKTTTVKADPTTNDTNFDNDFPVSFTMQPNTLVYVNVYADLDGQSSADKVINSKLSVTATGANSGSTAGSNANVGQTMTLKASAFAAAIDGSTPTSFLTSGNQTVVAAKLRMTATNSAYTLKETTLQLGSSVASGAVDHVELYDGTTLLGSGVFSDKITNDNDATTIVGMSLPIAANSYKIVTVKLVLGAIGSSNGASQVDTALKLVSVKRADSTGATAVVNVGTSGNTVRVTKAYPVVNAVDLTNTTVVNGSAQDLYKFTVTASGGDVALKQFKLPITWNAVMPLGSGVTADMTIGTLKLSDGSGSPIDASLVNFKRIDKSDAIAALGAGGLEYKATEGGAVAENDKALIVSFTNEYVIASGATVAFTLRGTPNGFATVDTNSIANDNTFSLYLAGDSAANNLSATNTSYLNESGAGSKVWLLATDAAAAGAGANKTLYNFVWSDVSATNHVYTDDVLSSGDWVNGYLVLNLDLQTETWSK